MEALDYPVAAPDDVHPLFYRAMIIQSMGLLFFKAMQQIPGEEADFDYAFECAKATWESDWGSDPEPRTIELAAEAVRDELQYWTEE